MLTGDGLTATCSQRTSIKLGFSEHAITHSKICDSTHYRRRNSRRAHPDPEFRTLEGFNLLLTLMG